MKMGPTEPQRLDVHVPTRTILKVVLAALVIWAALKLWPELVYLSISLVLAVALEPTIGWMDRRGISRGWGVFLLALLLLVCTGVFVGAVLPPLADQAADLIGDFPAFRARIEHRLPPHSDMLRKVVDQIFLLPSSPEVVAELNKPLVYGRAAVSTLMTTFFVLVATLYLLLDGRRLYAWCLAFVPRAHREKVGDTIPGVSAVIHAYVRGQVITSVLFGLFVAMALSLFGVPAVLPLASLAAICDVIPVIGIIIATAPAVLLAATVSPVTALAVLGIYGAYHLFETYFIVPRIYGHSLRLSTLVVLLALIIGGTLQGVLGAVMILPLVAAYPIVERIWLAGYLHREVLADHQALAAASIAGRSTAIEMVLQGEKHADEHRPSQSSSVASPGSTPSR